MNRALAALLMLAVAAPARAEWSSGGGAEVPLEGDGSSWIVRATINGSFKGRFLLDTGASLCVLVPAAARELSLQSTGQERRLHTANGEVRARVVRIQSIEIGSHRARDIEAIVHPAVPAPLSGVIGLSYLNNFQYSIDSKRRTLRFR